MFGHIAPNAGTQDFDNYDGLKAYAKDPSKINVIIQADRLGGKLFCVKMEYEHFPPRSGKNKLFDFHVVQWPYDEDNKPVMLWFIVSFPKEYLETAHNVAKECGVILEQGFPTVMMSWKGQVVDQEFPITEENCYILKNNKESLIYKNNHNEIEKQKDFESNECERIINADIQKMRKEFLSKGYTNEQIDRILHHWDNDDPNYIEPPEHGVPDGQNRMKHGK